MRFIRFLLEVSWRQIVIATVMGLISGCGNALLISLINQSVNHGILPNALLYFAVLGTFTLSTNVASQFVLIQLSQNAIFQLRMRLSRNILSSPLQHLEKLGENRLLATLTEDIRVLSHSVAAIPNLCIDAATVAGCLVYLAWFSNVLFALTIAFSAFAIWCVQTRLGKAQKLFAKAREEEDSLFKHFQSIAMGTKELKLHRSRREDFISESLQGSATQLRQKNTTAMKSFAIANGFGQLTQLVNMGIVLFVLPWFMHIPLSMLSTYVLTSTFIALPMQNLLNRVPDMVRGNISLRKIDRMKLSLSSLAETEEPITEPIHMHCEIELHQVSYLYQPDLEQPPHSFRPEEDFPEEPPQERRQGNRLENRQEQHPQHFSDRHPEHYQEQHPEFSPDRRPNHQNRRPNHHPDFYPVHSQERRPNSQPNRQQDNHQEHRSERHPDHRHGHHPQMDHFMSHPPIDEEKGFLLGPLNLTLKPGEITFIVGGNGSGKSTLAKLITGLYLPQTGSVYLNGVEVTEQNREWYRQHFSAIFSDFHLFDRCLGFKHNDLDREVEQYLKQLQLDHKVQVKDGVLSTTRLSQGQRKRLALLTAYLEDRPVYLFDEWASDQDPQFREVFYREILAKLKARGKTVIVITHDDRYFNLADHVIKLDYGKIVPNQVPVSSYLK